jgi:hypothetical protein
LDERPRTRVCKVGGQIKRPRLEVHQFRVARAAKRPQQLQIMNGLEKIRLSLAVLAHEYHALDRRRHVHAVEVAKIAHLDAHEPRARHRRRRRRRRAGRERGTCGLHHVHPIAR